MHGKIAYGAAVHDGEISRGIIGIIFSDEWSAIWGIQFEWDES